MNFSLQQFFFVTSSGLRTTLGSSFQWTPSCRSEEQHVIHVVCIFMTRISSSHTPARRFLILTRFWSQVDTFGQQNADRLVTQEMYLSGEPVDTSLRGNRLLGHLKNIIEAGERLEMGQGFLVGSIDLLTHCLSLQETGRKHLQAMQRTKSDADWLWLTDLVVPFHLGNYTA